MRIERLINRSLTFDPNASDYLKKLAGTCLKVEINDIISFYILFEEMGIKITTDSSITTPFIVRGPLLSFIKLKVTKNPQAAASLGLNFEGEPFILEKIQQFMFSLDIDWEEALAQKTNDIFAHRLGNIIRGIRSRTHRKFKMATVDFSEYLTEEAKILPTRTEMDIFLKEVDALKRDVERLETKIGMLC